MGESQSFPDGAGAAAGPAAGDEDDLGPSASTTPAPAADVGEGVLLSQLIRLLSQRPKHSLLLSDLGALLPERLRQPLKDQGGLRSWLAKYHSLFEVKGEPGMECVTLTLAVTGAEDLLAPPADDAAQRPATPVAPEEPPVTPSGAPASMRASLDSAVASPKDGLTTPALQGAQETWPSTPWTPPVGYPGSQWQVPPAPWAADASAVQWGAGAPWAMPGADPSCMPPPPAAICTQHASLEDASDEAAVQLRGLPYRATVQEVITFLGEHASGLDERLLNRGVQIVLNRDNRPSGFARIQFISPEAARRCRDDLDNRYMEDRYVEVFLYSERPSKGRLLKAEDGAFQEASAAKSAEEAPAATQEQVVQELRAQMNSSKNRQLLLSMLGVHLSAPARTYLKGRDGLRAFLAQYPDEFSVDGEKGRESVTYTPVDGAAPPDFTWPAEHPATAAGLASPSSFSGEPLSSPGRTTKANDPTPRSAQRGGMATPSDWGTPATPWDSSADGLRAPAFLPPWPAGDATGVAGSASAWAAPPAWPPVVAPSFWPGGWGAPGGAMPPAWAPPPSVPGATGTAVFDMAFAQQMLGGLPPPVPAAATQTPGNATSDTDPQKQQFQAQQLQAEAAAMSASSDGNTSTVRLRGLPFTSSEQDVFAFFAQFDIVDRIADGPKAVSLLFKLSGKPLGQAVVQMYSHEDAENAKRVLHGQWMGNRYIEVFLCGEEGDCGPARPAAATGSAPATAPAASAPAAAPATRVVLSDALPPATGGAGGNAGAPALWAPPPPWAMPGAMPGGMPGANASETSWEALFEFQWQGGMMPGGMPGGFAGGMPGITPNMPGMQGTMPSAMAGYPSSSPEGTAVL